MRETGWPLSQHPALTLAWQVLRISWLSKILNNYSWDVEGAPCCAVIHFCDGSKHDRLYVQAGNWTSERGWPPWKLKTISSVISWQAATQKVEIGINLIFTVLILMLLKKSKPFDCFLLERWLRPTPVMEATQNTPGSREIQSTRCLLQWHQVLGVMRDQGEKILLSGKNYPGSASLKCFMQH